MKPRDSLALLVALAFTVAACSSGSSTLSPAAGLPSARTAQHGAPATGGATLVITLPLIQQVDDPFSWEPPVVNRLSSATGSISGTVGTSKFGPIALGSGAPACGAATPGGPLKCVITVNAPLGTESLTMNTYATGKIKAPLATGTQSVQVFSGTNYATATLAGIARRVATIIEGTLRQGAFTTPPILAYGIDAAGRPIPGSISQGLQIGVQLTGFQTISLSRTCNYGDCRPTYCCGIISTFPYDGLATGRETVRTTSTASYNPVLTYATVQPGNTALATLLVQQTVAQSRDSFPTLLMQFAQNAAGNTAPARVVETSGVFAEDASGDYWAGSTHYSNLGAKLGSVNVGNYGPSAIDAQGHLYSTIQGCGFSEYPANSYGTLKPTRTVTCTGDATGFTVDAAGDVYLSFEYANGAATILEYGPSGSGSVPPIRTITTQTGGYASYQQLATDASGNLYAHMFGSSGLFEFAPGATIGRQLFPSLSVLAFAVDNAGDVYVAAEGSSKGPFSLEVFAPGSTTPARVLSGSAARLGDGISAIVVPR
jgi:hypothetical protein